jgi:AraC-like DNA-binding protein
MQIPHHLFVGTTENEPNCVEDSDSGVHDIWPKFLLMIILQGAQHFVIDGVDFRLEAGYGEACAPLVFMLNVARASKLRFFNESSVPLRKVMISAPLPWLKRVMETQQRGMPPLRNFFAGHLNRFSYQPGRHILQCAEQIMRPPQMLEGELYTMYRQAQALDIMWQSCLSLVADEAAAPQSPSLMSLRHCERIRDYIFENLDKELTIETIAAEAGASPSTVQRHFKEHFGVTVFDFIRHKRLEMARCALETEGIPISRAAYLAGYNSLSSFTTAFRKTYGMTPKKVRA